MPVTSPVIMLREEKQNFRLWGQKCRECGAFLFPRKRVCPHCHAKDKFDDVKLSKRGKLLSFSEDYVVPAPFTPLTLGVVEFEGGGRLMLQMADCEVNELQIGMTVELCFRNLYVEDGFNNYFWKCRLVK